MPMPMPTHLQQMLLACVRTLSQPVANINVFDLSTMLSVVLLVLSSHVALSAAAAALTLQSEAARVDLFAGWSRDELDCFGTTCPSERVYNIFLDAPPPSAAGQSFCEWSDAFVAAGALFVRTPVACATKRFFFSFSFFFFFCLRCLLCLPLLALGAFAFVFAGIVCALCRRIVRCALWNARAATVY